ncbi:MAG TPA: carbamoyl-phosphate synthase large subunit [Candidatus Dormibacteraeota bacterium]|nr:carbamoyl-phosphate synthase large subunit [Candidatus Dormibacteraeota bacterium]
MPLDKSIKTVLIIGSGPIVIGQACEFDYSGSQAARSLREEGIKVILINSNPATIMTDPMMADKVYLLPLTPESIEKIIEETEGTDLQIDAVLATMGGQTALNLAKESDEMGIWEKNNIRLIGVDIKAIDKAEDREKFRAWMVEMGIPVAPAKIANSFLEGKEIAQEIGFPLVLRPSFTLGGTGGSIVFQKEKLDEALNRGLTASPMHEVLVEKAMMGWKEFELELLRDDNDNVVIICTVENFDPMGVHTGDSITVAPIQTLTDKEYQIMRDASFAVIRAVGVETGGSNIQFAVDPDNGRMVIIEMNPRVSRSSALASKATGFPIAKIAAKLAVGYLLDEIRNDITRETPASFEPTIDYVVTKIPRFAFEKFPQADPTLNTQMKSVGEAMAIGRTFKESLQKALRSLEIGRSGLGGDGKPWRFGEKVYGDREKMPRQLIMQKLSVPNAERIFFIRHALRAGFGIEELFNLTKIDRWFLAQIKEIVDFEEELAGVGAA